VLEGGDHGGVHVALATDRRRVGEIVRHRAHRLKHLLAATPFALGGLGARERLERTRGCKQRAEILERDVGAGYLAQEGVDLARGDATHSAVLAAILE